LRQYLTQSGLKESTVPAKLVTGFSLRCDQPAFMLLSLELPIGILFSPGGALLLIAMLAERIFSFRISQRLLPLIPELLKTLCTGRIGFKPFPKNPTLVLSSGCSGKGINSGFAGRTGAGTSQGF
jgi:hypothetical protein